LRQLPDEEGGTAQEAHGNGIACPSWVRASRDGG
jgi:hypothetical protein